MIGVVVAAHGELAQALVQTAELVVQTTGNVVALGVRTDDDSASFEARFRAAVVQVQAQREEVLVLTDMFGGTPSNIGMTLHRAGHVEVLTGVNLPMLIKALQLMDRDTDLATIARQAKESGARAIAIASEVLGGAGPMTEKKA
jgi:PTS system mannose-specific IIA component